MYHAEKQSWRNSAFGHTFSGQITPSGWNKKVSGISSDAMKSLELYDWPGNVRQLENEIERAVTLVEPGAFIKADDFSEEVYRYAEHNKTLNMLSGRKTLKDAIEELEKQMIMNCLENYQGDETQAAKELGISRSVLSKKMQRYELYREEE
jgi:transcriptional regulator with PAS, ATPase and Fis domain